MSNAGRKTVYYALLIFVIVLCVVLNPFENILARLAFTFTVTAIVMNVVVLVLKPDLDENDGSP